MIEIGFSIGISNKKNANSAAITKQIRNTCEAINIVK
jgi:hypothetical protein